MNGRRLLTALATVGVLLTSACAPAASSGPAATGGASKPSVVAPAVRWKHGIVAAKADASYLLMAREKALFAERGLDVEYIEFQSDATAAQALIAGELDTMEANPSATIAAVAQGTELRIIGTTMPGMPYALYSRNTINTLQDLRGKTLGISAPGALPEVIAKAMLLSQGVAPDAVSFSNAGGDAQRFAALSAGKVDAVAAATEFTSEVNRDPNLRVLALASDLVPEYLRFVIVANAQTLNTKRDAAVNFDVAMAQGLRYALDHRDEALALCGKTIGEPATAERCTSTYDLVKEKKYVNPNMEFDTGRLNWLQDLRIKIGQQQTPVPLDKLLDLSIRDEAIQKIGKI